MILMLHSIGSLLIMISVDTVKDNVINEFALNKKQKVAFEKAIANVVKRIKGEEVTQNLIYVGGPARTGKSQIIKAIVSHSNKAMQYTPFVLIHWYCSKEHRREHHI